MKKLAFLLILIIGVVSNVKADNATIVAPTTNSQSNYVLYPTVNMYNFLKLDTRNGKIWQVQFAMDDNNETTVPLNMVPLTTNEKPGQFALYPTSNMWTFLLLNTENGDVYHVQWSLEAQKRGIVKIDNMF